MSSSPSQQQSVFHTLEAWRRRQSAQREPSISPESALSDLKEATRELDHTLAARTIMLDSSSQERQKEDKEVAKSLAKLEDAMRQLLTKRGSDDLVQEEDDPLAFLSKGDTLTLQVAGMRVEECESRLRGLTENITWAELTADQKARSRDMVPTLSWAEELLEKEGARRTEAERELDHCMKVMAIRYAELEMSLSGSAEVSGGRETSRSEEAQPRHTEGQGKRTNEEGWVEL